MLLPFSPDVRPGSSSTLPNMHRNPRKHRRSGSSGSSGTNGVQSTNSINITSPKTSNQRTSMYAEMQIQDYLGVVGTTMDYDPLLMWIDDIKMKFSSKSNFRTLKWGNLPSYCNSFELSNSRFKSFPSNYCNCIRKHESLYYLVSNCEWTRQSQIFETYICTLLLRDEAFHSQSQRFVLLQ